MATIRDVAKMAGVAVSTVSKVINHYPNVSAETTEKVNKAIEALQFTPNVVAAALSSKQSGRVALIINTDIQTSFIDEVSMKYLSGAIARAQELHVDVVSIFFSMLEGKDEAEVENYLQSQNVKGIVVYGMSKDDVVLRRLVEQGRIKSVLVDAPIVNESTSCISVDQLAAQKDIARKTIIENSTDIKKVLYISGKKNGFVSEERLNAIMELSEEINFEVNVQCGEFSERMAREITFEYGSQYDIIVCASDMMAIGAMRALTDMDIFRPVCGFDGISLMGYAGKQMNTVKQNFYEISAEALSECVRLMSGGRGNKIVMPHELVRLEYLDMIR